MSENRYVAHGVVAVDGRYLLLHRGSGRYMGDHWDLPGGTVEPGEQPHEAVERECLEEAGLRCTAGEVLTHYTNKDTKGEDIYFHTVTFALDLEGPADVTISHEHQGYRWVTLAEAQQLPLMWHCERTLRTLADE